MGNLTIDQIRKRFETSTEFNEIFDAFELAIGQRLEDLELYRLLFWNPTLIPDELCLFGEKLTKEFPGLSFETYMWLARVFEATHSVDDNYELALKYYRKAAKTKPEELNPYLKAAGCYEADLNIPPLISLIEFLKLGVGTVRDPAPLYEQLAHLYELAGNDEMSSFYRRKFKEGSAGPAVKAPEE